MKNDETTIQPEEPIQKEKEADQRFQSLPKIYFYDLPIGLSARRQLDQIDRANRDHPQGRDALQRLILQNRFDMKRGVYLPVSHEKELWKKKPIPADVDFGPVLRFFSNGLLIPEGFNEGWMPNETLAPSLRVTNVGFLIITIEHDCQTLQQFEEILEWTRSCNSDGDFSRSRFAELDRELRQLKEYRGHSIVYSGNKSLHFHFLFSIEHLQNAPFDRPDQDRRRDRRETALITNVHEMYWDHVNALFVRVLNPSMPSDPGLRSVVQWRQAPFGIRILDNDSPILGLRKGAMVPQLVFHEDLFSRAPRGAKGLLVPKDFSLANPVSRPKPTGTHAGVSSPAPSDMIKMIQAYCRTEWGEYPRPVQVQKQDDGEWTIKFKNHPHDQTPSTIVKGGYRRLILRGQHAYGDRQFFVPDGMSAQEMCDLAERRLGINPGASPAPLMLIIPDEPRRPLTPLEQLKQDSLSDESPIDLISRNASAGFALPISDAPLPETKAAYRRRLYRSALNHRLGRFIIVKSVEGIGKTQALLAIVFGEIEDDWRDDRTERFGAVSFRSRDQTQKKAEEFRRHGHRVALIEPFRAHYEAACHALNQTPIPQGNFDDNAPSAIFRTIRGEQPGVFDLLEKKRRNLWNRNTPFVGPATLLVMTHKMAETWDMGVLSRAWYHPEFDPFAAPDQHRALRDRFRLSRLVLDDPEVEDFVQVLSASAFEFLSGQQSQYPNWRNEPASARRDVFLGLREAGPFKDFETFDEAMRLDLSTLDLVRVDFDAIPFGYDHGERGIYRAKHGTPFRVGPQPWIRATTANCTFLTTETLVVESIKKAIDKSRHQGVDVRSPAWLDLTDVPPIFPVKIPVRLDPLARSDRRGGPERVTALAREIATSNPAAFIIADGVKGRVANTVTFQGMKGLNGLEERDVFAVVTNLHPDAYAKWNVIGQWLGQPDVISMHYQDQINQAVGRNRGFRQSDGRETQTVIITSSRLWKHLLGTLNGNNPRVQLYMDGG